ncbi:MAG: TetR/AcrR family transcriptional regulator [Erysipelothrix sp.]|nr:TetR/AcrR family transcriptional regulator [Erysipelothrix sp.]
MENLLTNVNEDKRERIINSALKEFSLNTFDKASTNVIVKDAAVSKGTLFHYFGSKEKLYKYLEYFSVNVISEAILKDLNWDEKDIFLRLKRIIMTKLKVFIKYPYLADFSVVVFKDKSPKDIMLIDPTLPQDLYSQIYTYNIDMTLFKEDIDISRAINIVMWTMEKYTDNLRIELDTSDSQIDFKQIEKELYVYMDILKGCFYK